MRKERIPNHEFTRNINSHGRSSSQHCQHTRNRHGRVAYTVYILKEISNDRVFIVMDFIEHDLKALMENMREPFLQSEVKTLMLQLLSATALMHELWIIHRDLKTSNLLMTNRGMMKIADFGLARYFGEPVINMTQLVVTLWYR